MVPLIMIDPMTILTQTARVSIRVPTRVSLKVPIVDDNVNEVMYDEKLDSEDGSTHKQDGVKRVEAITTVWTKKTLVLMFIL